MQSNREGGNDWQGPRRSRVTSNFTLGSGYDSISFQGLDYSLFNFELQCENSQCISSSKTLIAVHVFCRCSCHSSAATCPALQPPSAVKNNPAETLVGQKSLPAYVISKPGIPNPHQQSLIWTLCTSGKGNSGCGTQSWGLDFCSGL